MTQTEWIISIDDDLKDHDELFVGNVRDGDRLIRCKDCKHWESMPSSTGAPDIHKCRYWRNGTVAYDYCGRAERKEE